ncbi:ATP-binding cassette domain-containing protein [Paenibacillus sp. 7124]|uniref:ATP-binding cassette domain-containing protein n=1 Tax=Paenibacillus apii TaxID=1850370 RepID=A0A6M1PPZ1_9BACL|nr:ATP-binding cassette domain-containing protein [Paenibacillus apii]NGM84424.1 ATP-binding cassette domain-containing protein [Paenibacillus apii]NJJ38374.1 ATP-binding cassette domain-containing protein [Paenibacillus apii]
MKELDGKCHSAGHVTDAIVLEDVSFGYDPAQPILHGLSLSIPQGQWVSLVGESGSGKSTLAKLLNALLPKSAGEITVCGERLSEDTILNIRRKIGMVFQNPDNQFVGETVEEDILFGLEGLCLSREEMDRRLRLYAGKLGITGLLAKHPGELSGGQKQRVAIVSILAMEPGVVIFDEASSMLDEESRNGLLDILRDMHAEGYTILMITHDADEIMASQRVLALCGGGLAGDMTPAELFSSPGLLEACRLHAPYAWELSRELEARGITIGVPASEKELIETLWPFNSSK